MNRKIINVLFYIGFVFYTLFLLWNIPFKYVSPLEVFSTNRYFSRTLNLIPFCDIFNGIYNGLDIWGNIILFIPLGIYVNMISKNSRVYKSICKIFSISLIFEVSQYVFGIGASDITDIITNTIGGIVGIGIYMVIKEILKEDERVKKFITICSIVIMIPVSTILILLFIYN
ncbi:VanZ family protein [Clostridium sp. L74]|uniref:VanZ family protein n=1 Tax=Clostridium sp. L74 TaxID=1560217 RepID=UPI0006ABED7A|nr:VanZ family protein [Clostridium sp. L74]KOR24979.1 membrane protein [Clostridium sp. L74]